MTTTLDQAIRDEITAERHRYSGAGLALLDVLDLHTPDADGWDPAVCDHCRETREGLRVPYPCKTVQLIAAALHVPLTTRRRDDQH